MKKKDTNIEKLNLILRLKDIGANPRRVAIITSDSRSQGYFALIKETCPIPISIFPDLDSFVELLKTGYDFDSLVVDFDLDQSNGLEVAEYINLFIKRVPTIIISGIIYFDTSNGDLPSYVDSFIPKSLGTVYILKMALIGQLREGHYYTRKSV